METSNTIPSPEERLANVQAVQARLSAGEVIQPDEVNPLTHSPELVALVHQALKGQIGF